MKSAVLSSFLALTLLGCSAGERAAVDSRGFGANEITVRYPSGLYIVRSGRGGSPEEAAEAARFEIVKYFESRISGETRIRQWAKGETKRGKLIEQRLTEVSNSVSVSGEREIQGIDIVATKRVGNTGLYEAWAVLSRSTYAEILLDRIGKMDGEIDSRLKSAPDGDLAEIRNLARIARLLVERGRMVQDLKLVSSAAAVRPRDGELAAVLSSIDSLVTYALEVRIVFTGDMDAAVESSIVKGITDSGIRVKKYRDTSSAAGDSVDLILSVSHSVTARKSTTTIDSEKHELHWSEWTLTLKAVDPATGGIIDALVLSDRTGGRDGEQAHSRMVYRIEKTQVPAVSAWIYDLVFKP